jgi:hypothetical protein
LQPNNGQILAKDRFKMKTKKIKTRCGGDMICVGVIPEDTLFWDEAGNPRDTSILENI